MLSNLAAAVLLNAVTFLIHAGGLMAISSVMARLTGHPVLKDSSISKLIALTAIPFALFLLICVEIGAWALGFMMLGAFADFETAFYFSTSSFATIGFGDVTPVTEWGLLASLEGVTGFLVISLSAAYLVTSGIRFGPFEREKHF